MDYPYYCWAFLSAMVIAKSQKNEYGPRYHRLPMHSFLIAASFVLIVLSPCVAAQFTERRPSRARALRTNTLKTQGLRSRIRKKLAPVEVLDELEDPWPSTMLQKRAVLLDGVRSGKLRRVHLAAADPKSRTQTPVALR